MQCKLGTLGKYSVGNLPYLSVTQVSMLYGRPSCVIIIGRVKCTISICATVLRPPNVNITLELVVENESIKGKHLQAVLS